MMSWVVTFHDAFETEFQALALDVRESLAASVMLLVTYGPQLGRPHADTLVGSKHSNMKELRFATEDGVWRVAFAFDPSRSAILLVAGDKAGVAQKRFYKALIDKADKRFSEHLSNMKER
jgi:hypothetical protein